MVLQNLEAKKLNFFAKYKTKRWRKRNGEVHSEYTPLVLKRHKKQSNDQWRLLFSFTICNATEQHSAWHWLIFDLAGVYFRLDKFSIPFVCLYCGNWVTTRASFSPVIWFNIARVEYNRPTQSTKEPWSLAMEMQQHVKYFESQRSPSF